MIVVGEHSQDQGPWYEPFRAPDRYNKIQRVSHYAGIGIGTVAVLLFVLFLVWGAVRAFGWLVGTVLG